MKKSVYVALAMVAALGMAGCSTKESNTVESVETVTEVDLETIKTAVVEAYGDDYIPNMGFDAQMMESVIGLDMSLVDQYIAEGPMISTNVDTFIAVEASKGRGADVEASLKDYQERLLSDTLQYPMNLIKIQASDVVRYGDYVFFVMLGSASKESELESEEAALASAKENNQIGLDVIASFFQ